MRSISQRAGGASPAWLRCLRRLPEREPSCSPMLPDECNPHAGASQPRGAMGDRAQSWKQRLERSPHGLAWISVASFLESIVVPIPLEVVLVPYLLARRDRLWTIATGVTAGCLLGALVGYGVGHFLIEGLGRTWIEQMGWAGDAERFRSLFRDHGFWAIVGIGIAPIPFQVAMLVAGAAAYPVPLFLLAAGLARGIRYYGLAALVALFEQRAERLWEEHATAVFAAAGALCALGVLASVLGAGR